MKTFDKSTVYAKLSEIRKSGIDTSKYIRMVAENKDIPYDVIVFINKNIPIDQLYTYNKIYENRRKNPLYKNLVNENLSTEDRAIALSSLLTQILIRNKSLIESNEISDRTEYISIMDPSIILESLNIYFNEGDTSKLDETFLMIRDIFKKLY